MAKRDYYEVLGVSKDADIAAIKRAFKRLAVKYHPDHNKDPNAGEKFREINEAYQVLSDESKRRAYDQYGFEGLSGAGGSNPFGGGQDFNDIFGDIFSDIFGSQGRRSSGPAQVRGHDLRVKLTLSLEEAVRGTTKKINIKTFVTCDACHGSGAAPGSSKRDCPHCSGMGQVHVRNGFMTFSQTCPKCKGTGVLIDNPCRSCQGSGRVERQKGLSVNIPAGVDTGDRLSLPAQGEAGMHGAPAGDVIVYFEVREHPIFERDGNDLHCNLPISFTTAALGGQIEVPTLDGRVNITIKPETQTGTIMRLSGKGVKSYNSMSKGNLYCHVTVETPVNLTREQKDLLTRFEASLNGDESEYASEDSRTQAISKHKPRSEGFLKSMRKFFDDLSK